MERKVEQPNSETGQPVATSLEGHYQEVISMGRAPQQIRLDEANKHFDMGVIYKQQGHG